MKINNIEVREIGGLFCVNDLYLSVNKPAGREPWRFKDTETCKSLINIIRGKNEDEQNQWVSRNICGDRITLASERLCIAYAMFISPEFYLKVIDSFIEHHNWQEELDKAITVKATILDRMCSKEGLYTITDSAAEVSKILGVVVSSQDLNAYLREGGFHKHWYNKTRPSCWRDEVVKKGYAGHTTRKDNYGNKRKQLRLTTRGQCRLACQLEKEFVWIMFLGGWVKYQASK